MQSLEKMNKEPKIPLEMYSVPGEPAITEHSFNRYVRDKKQDEVIKELAIPKQVPKVELVLPADPEKVAEFLEKALQDNDPKVQVAAIEKFKNEHLEVTEMMYLTRNALRSTNLDVWEKAAEAVKSIYSEKYNLPLRAMVSQRIEEYLRGNNSIAQEVAMRCVLCADKDDTSSLVKKGLETENERVQLEAVKQIQYLGFGKVESLIEQALTCSSAEVRKRCLTIMEVVIKSKVDDFIRTGLKDASLEVRKEAAAAIKHAHKAQDLILECLNNAEIPVQIKALKKLEDLAGIYGKPIKEGIMSKIDKAFEDSDLKTLTDSAWMIPYLPKEKKQATLQRFIDEGLGSYVIQSPLYNLHYINEKGFSRQAFEKTGSETTLIGGSLKDKAIIRHIVPGAFLAWQRLYEDYKGWEKAGFDYIPIEPIYSYTVNKDGLVDVYSGVLDLSFQQWIDKGGNYIDELNQEVEKIMKFLKDNDVEHGHNFHRNNVCLKFFRDSEGNPVFTKQPRAYLIDFDGADSPSY